MGSREQLKYSVFIYWIYVSFATIKIIDKFYNTKVSTIRCVRLKCNEKHS